MVINPAQLDKRVQIQRRVAGRDAHNQPLDGWENVARVWARIRSLRAAEEQKNAAEVNTGWYTIDIRRRVDIDESMRLVYKSDVFEIKGIHDRHSRSDYMHLQCKATS